MDNTEDKGLSRRKALGRIGALALGAYTAPAFTTLSVARALRRRKRLTVVTNNLSVATVLSEEVANRITLPGGELRQPGRDFVGDEVVEFFGRHRAEFAIFGTAGIEADGSLLEFHQSEVRAMETLRRNAHKTILVIDRSKFGRLAPAVGGNLIELDLVVCDRPPGAPFQRLTKALGDKIAFAEGTEEA